MFCPGRYPCKTSFRFAEQKQQTETISAYPRRLSSYPVRCSLLMSRENLTRKKRTLGPTDRSRRRQHDRLRKLRRWLDRLCTLCRLQPAAQHLGDAPRLGNAAARRVGSLGIEDLADLSNARLTQ